MGWIGNRVLLHTPISKRVLGPGPRPVPSRTHSGVPEVSRRPWRRGRGVLDISSGRGSGRSRIERFKTNALHTHTHTSYK